MPETPADTRMFYIRQKSGEIQGPFPAANIRRWLKSGKLKPEMSICEDRENWVRCTGATALLDGPIETRGLSGEGRSAAVAADASGARREKLSDKDREGLLGCGGLVVVILFFLYACSTPSLVDRVVTHKGRRVAIIPNEFTYFDTKHASYDITDALGSKGGWADFVLAPSDRLEGMVRRAKNEDVVEDEEVDLICFQWLAKKTDEYGKEVADPIFWALVSVETIKKIEDPERVSELNWLRHLESHGQGKWKPTE